MEKNIILAQIGKSSKYSEVKYKKFNQNNASDPSAYDPTEADTLENENIDCTKSCYSFEVILKEMEKKMSGKADFLILVGTQESSWARLCEVFGDKYKKEYSQLKSVMQEETDGCGGISNILEIQKEAEKFLTECLNGTCVRILIQKNGITRMESKENFNLLTGLLSEVLDNKKQDNGQTKINLHLDISNGFRSFPIYVFLASNYMKQMRPKEESIRIFLYYGMFEKKLELKQGKFVSSYKGDYVPYVDMSDASDMMQWTDAVIEFYNNGSVIQMLKILDTDTYRGWADTPIGDGQNTISSVFQKFNYAMNSNHLKLLEETTGLLARLDEYLDDSLPDYAKNLLSHISKDFKERFENDGENGSAANHSKYGTLSVRIAEWYLDQQRIGDAVIALQEGMITYVMEKFSTKCETLINKKREGEMSEISRGALPGDRALFDFEYREMIRKHVFDTRDIEEKEWLREYKYLCENLRDPAMRMQYNVNDQFMAEKDIGRAAEHAAEAVRELAGNIRSGKLDGCIEKCLDDLLHSQEHDFFISYRRTSLDTEDGVKAAQGIADFLSEHNYDVFMDKSGLAGTAGEFPPKIRDAVRNSHYVILLLGKTSFEREYSEKDYYYMEIQTATEKHYKKEIFVVQLEGFERPRSLEHFPDTLKEEIRKIVDEYQHVGDGRKWGYSEQEQKEMRQELLKAIQKNRDDKQKNRVKK